MSSLSTRLMGALVAVVLGACAMPEGPTDFEPGDEKDPIVKAVSALSAANQDTLTLTVENKSGYAVTAGLLLFSAPAAVNTSASAAMINYADQTSAGAGNATLLAQALGLTVGQTAFVVPAIAKDASATLTITVPSNVKLTYLARVATSLDDFLMATDIALSGATPGVVTAPLKGYDLRGRTGKTTLGNCTTGSSPSSTRILVNNTSDCPAGPLTASTQLFADDFSAGAGATDWPTAYGWDGEFNGDWYTDGVTTRVYNPNWGGAEAAAPIPAVTGFWKRVDVCPGSGSRVHFTAKIATSYTDATSDATLVLYFFNRAGTLLGTAASFPLFAVNDREFALYDAVMPASTRQVVVAPMARLGATEQETVFYDRVRLDYEPAGAVTSTLLASDDFSRTSNNTFGRKQPRGWEEFGGDWYAMTAQKWATLGNPAWYGGAAGVDTGLVKTFDLSGLKAGDRLDARVFAAATFSDVTSFARLRVVFNDSAGSVVESQRQVRGYGYLDVRRQPIPAGATRATLIINAFLGPAETSSLYVDDVSLSLVR